MRRYQPTPTRSHQDDRDELLIALDDDPELAPYLEAFDRLIQEPRMAEYSDAATWWRRVQSAALAERTLQ